MNTRKKDYEILGVQSVNKKVLLKVLESYNMNDIESFEMLELTAHEADHGWNREFIKALKEKVSNIKDDYFKELKIDEEWTKRNHAAGEAIQKKQDLTMQKIIRDLEILSEKHKEDIGAATGLPSSTPKANQFLLDAMRAIVKYTRAKRIREDRSSYLTPNSKGFI